MSRISLYLFALLVVLAAALPHLSLSAAAQSDDTIDVSVTATTSDSSDDNVLIAEESDDLDDISDFDIEDFYTEPATLADIRSHPDIVTTVYIPTTQNGGQATVHSSKGKQQVQLPLDEDSTLIVGLKNTGYGSFNLSFMQGGLVSPYDTSLYIQNFSVQPIERSVLGPKQQISLIYRIHPDEGLEPINYKLNGFVLYNTSNSRVYKSEWQTPTAIHLIDKKRSWFDLQTISAWLMAVGLLGGGVYAALYTFAPKLLSGSSGRRRQTAAKPSSSKKAR